MLALGSHTLVMFSANALHERAWTHAYMYMTINTRFAPNSNIVSQPTF